MKKTPVVFSMALFLIFHHSTAQTFNEILGRPTNKSVTISVLFSQVVEVKFEYGKIPGNFSSQTPTFTSQPETPVVADLQPLEADTRYYYRTVYRQPGAANFKFGEIRSFHTQRAPGERFTFTIEADEHLYDKKGIRNLYEICLDNQARDSADFMISLGDTFGDDHTPLETTNEEMRELHLDYRQYLGRLCHSSPFLFCLGNHEGESGYWLEQTPPNNIAVYGSNWRKFYFPNPFPNDFYAGNSTQEPYGIGYPENYYAFTWGDALFVVLDVYRDCDVSDKPQNWEWTLGETQYNWLHNTLESSTARHKFVFAHHNRGQGRGGIEPARGFEWGGYGNNGNGAWEFDQMRPGWDMPIHQLMVANHVNIFFQGHDHLYAWEQMDGLVYQEVPMPSDTSYEIGVLANADAYTDLTIDGSGHLRVTVDENCVTVDYVAAYLPEDTSGMHKNGEIRHSYQLCNGVLSAENQSFMPENDFSVYPNPASGKLMIQTKTAANPDRRVDVFDIQGALVRSALIAPGAGILELELSGLKSGVYLVRFSDGRTLHWRKFMALNN